MLKDAFIQLFETTFRRADEIKFDKRENVDNTLMALYGTIIEQSGSVVFLIKNDYYGGMEAILRSVLEAYIDVINLDRNDKYLDQLLLELYASKKKVGEQAAKGNRWLTGMNTKEVADKHAEWVEKYDALFATAKPHLNKFDRFDLAGEAETYRTVYMTLCDEAHNNAIALTGRHYRETPDGDFELVIFAEPEKEHADMVYDIFARILNHTNHIMHGRYGSPALEDIKTAGAKLEEARKAFDEQQ